MSNNNSFSDSEKYLELIRLIEQNNIKVINFVGYSKSGKTTSIESLIKWLKSAKGNNVKIAVVKNIAHNDMAFDVEGKNTFRYSQAGADIVFGNSVVQSVMIINKKIDLLDIISHINLEVDPSRKFEKAKAETIIILEGFRDFPGPSVLAIRTIEDIESQFSNKIKFFTGSIGADLLELQKLSEKYKIPYIDCMKEPEKLYYLLFGTNA